jgi:hypothetical protein
MKVTILDAPFHFNKASTAEPTRAAYGTLPALPERAFATYARDALRK